MSGGRARGRPPLPPEDRLDERLTFRTLTGSRLRAEGIAATINDQLRHRSWSAADVLRLALDQGLAMLEGCASAAARARACPRDHERAVDQLEVPGEGYCPECQTDAHERLRYRALEL